MKKIYALIIIIAILLLGNINAGATNQKSVKKVDFIHTLKDSNEIKKSKDICYGFTGEKWKQLPVNYVINPTNSQGLSESFVISAISESAETWDKAIGKNLFDSYTVDNTAVAGVRDGKNTIAFGFYPSNSVIAFASVWKTEEGEILEADVFFNTVFSWGDATQNQWVIDLQSLATHEIGHLLGLIDIDKSYCGSVTMYRYSGYGETEKRTLEKADITGLKKLYRKK